MAEIFPGSARLRTRAILCHPRYARDGSPFIFVDANVQPLWSHEHPILCSLRYYLFLRGQSVLPGVYDIVARVSLKFICAFVHDFIVCRL